MSERITASLNRSIEQNADVWRELAGECTVTAEGGNVKRIGTIDGMANVLLTDDEWLAIRDDLPPLPTCFLCGKESPWLMGIGYESQYDEEHICPQCNDEAIDLLKAKKGEE